MEATSTGQRMSSTGSLHSNPRSDSANRYPFYSVCHFSIRLQGAETVRKSRRDEYLVPLFRAEQSRDMLPVGW